MRRGLINILITITILMAVFNVSNGKEDKRDSVDIKISEMVKAEIANAGLLQRMNKQNINTKVEDKEELQTVNDMLFYSLSFSFILNIFFLIIFIRINKNRKNNRAKKRNVDQSFKKNISLLRQEKIGVKNNTQLSKIRNRLRYLLYQKKINESALLNNAKKMSLSHGELLLASRLNGIVQKNK